MGAGDTADRRRVLAALAALAAAVLGVTAPAVADPGDGGVWAGSDGAGYSAGATYTVTATFGGTVTASTSAAGPPPTCYYVPTGDTAADVLADPWVIIGHGDTVFDDQFVRVGSNRGVPADAQERAAQEAAGNGGTYWSPMCAGSRWTGDIDAFMP